MTDTRTEESAGWEGGFGDGFGKAHRQQRLLARLCSEVGRAEVGRAEVGRAEVSPVEVGPAEVGRANAFA